MIFVVESGNGDIIERMWRLMCSARRNRDEPYIWRLTEDILQSVQAFYGMCTTAEERDTLRRLIGGGGEEADEAATAASAERPATVTRFLDIPVDPTTTMPHLLCRPDVVYHL